MQADDAYEIGEIVNNWKNISQTNIHAEWKD